MCECPKTQVGSRVRTSVRVLFNFSADCAPTGIILPEGTHLHADAPTIDYIYHGSILRCACSMGCSTQQPSRTEAVAATPKCLDVSGKYVIQGEDGQVHISILQERCDRATIRRDSGYLGKITSEEHVLKLDGTVQEDSPWLGSTDRYETSAKFNNSALQIEARTGKGSTLTMIYSLTPDGDLREDALINGRSGGSFVAKREK